MKPFKGTFRVFGTNHLAKLHRYIFPRPSFSRLKSSKRWRGKTPPAFRARRREATGPLFRHPLCGDTPQRPGHRASHPTGRLRRPFRFVAARATLASPIPCPRLQRTATPAPSFVVAESCSAIRELTPSAEAYQAAPVALVLTAFRASLRRPQRVASPCLTASNSRKGH